MPGVLIDEMPFALDSSFESPASFYHQHQLQLQLHQSPSTSPLASPSSIQQHQQQQLLELLASVNCSSPPQSSSSPSSCSPEFHRFLPSNNTDESSWSAEDVYSCDEFRMFEFKVRRCMRGRSHDWTECPFAHPGEKARRRDPRRFHYSGTACPDFRKGNCKNGDACELAHGVFECWLHPARYRTQPCKDGRSCKRRVCFFAHTSEQLRLLNSGSGSSPSSAGSSSSASDSGHRSSSPCSSPRRGSSGECWCSGLQPQYRAVCCGSGSVTSRSVSSPTSTLTGVTIHSPPTLSPPLSPSASPPMSPSGGLPRRYTDNRRLYSAPSSPCSAGHRNPAPPKTMSELVTALQQLELHRQYSPSPLRPGGIPCGVTRGLSVSVPVTPTSVKGRWETMWEMDLGEEEAGEEEMMAVPPRVESGRDLRARIYGRLANRAEALGGCGVEIPVNNGEPGGPDLNWVNDLVTE